MLRLPAALATAALLVLLPSLLGGCKAPDWPAYRANVKEELLEREQAWLDCYQARDGEAMVGFLAADFQITYPDGRVMDRAQTIASMEGEPRADGSGQWTEDTTIRLHRYTAVLTGVYVHADGRGNEQRLRYTDTWVHQGLDWVVLASVLTPLSPSER